MRTLCRIPNLFAQYTASAGRLIITISAGLHSLRDRLHECQLPHDEGMEHNHPRWSLSEPDLQRLQVSCRLWITVYLLDTGAVTDLGLFPNNPVLNSNGLEISVPASVKFPAESVTKLRPFPLSKTCLDLTRELFH